MGVIKVDENDPVGELEPSFPFRDVKILHNVDVRDFYDLKEEIGRGKFGTVYRCVEKKTGIVLAAKFVPIAKKQDRINVEREVEIMRTLQHPRLIQIYDSFEIHNVMCVVLELIEGGELFERVIDDDFILTEKACAVFMRQICEGVSFIHQNKIIHLDLKPENILCLTKTGNRIKIIDFGLARKYDPNKKLQVLFGTPEFVAPEVVNFDEITIATDMWSVGVICYVLLSGLSPFMGENDLQTMTNVTMAQYDFDDEAFDCISADAKDFISKLLVKNKEKRLTAGECANHPWLKRKPPPPMYLEQSKENLKTYVDSMHASSPFLLSETLSNGTVNSEGYIVPSPELVKPKVPTETPNKPLPVIVAPEITPLVDNRTISLEEQNLKIQNEINLNKSAENLPVLVKEPSISKIVVSPPSPSDKKTVGANEEKESISKKAVKTDSFKELPRKFSITASDGSRELPRRSSLTRADKAKEIKRETFVTFVGPREIKPVDSISLDVKQVVEELSTFIKSNIEESSLLKINHDSVTSARESLVEISSSASSSNSVNQKNVHNENNNKIGLESIAEGSVTKTESAQVPSCSNISNKSSGATKAKIDKENVVTPLLRPADYLKFTNKSKDSFSVSTPPGEKVPKDTTASFKPNLPSRDVDNSVLSSKDKLLSKSNSIIQMYSSESLKSLEKSDKILGKVANFDNKSQIFKSIESPKMFDSGLNPASDKKVTTTYSSQSSTSSFAKDTSYTGKSNVLSSLKDSSQVTGSSSRSQSVFESKKKSSVGDVSDSLSKFKSSDSGNIYSYFSSSTIRGDSTLPRKSQVFRQNENSSGTKDNTSVSSSENKRTRATSLDPTPVGPSWLLSNDPPFQSRFLRSTSQFKTESNSYRSSSEVVSNKYEEFRNRYSNYKDLVMDNEKLVKKSLISERMTPSRSLDKVEDLSKSQATTSQAQSSSSKQTPAVSQSATLPSYSLRQKFNLDDPKRDLIKYDFRSSKLESSFSKDRYTPGAVSSVKESTSSKFSQVSTQKSETKSKVSLPEKCPTSPQKSL